MAHLGPSGRRRAMSAPGAQPEVTHGGTERRLLTPLQTFGPTDSAPRAVTSVFRGPSLDFLILVSCEA
jgi:hypothetical protein